MMRGWTRDMADGMWQGRHHHAGWDVRDRPGIHGDSSGRGCCSSASSRPECARVTPGRRGRSRLRRRRVGGFGRCRCDCRGSGGIGRGRWGRGRRRRYRREARIQFGQGGELGRIGGLQRQELVGELLQPVGLVEQRPVGVQKADLSRTASVARMVSRSADRGRSPDAWPDRDTGQNRRRAESRRRSPADHGRSSGVRSRGGRSCRARSSWAVWPGGGAARAESSRPLRARGLTAVSAAKGRSGLGVSRWKLASGGAPARAGRGGRTRGAADASVMNGLTRRSSREWNDTTTSRPLGARSGRPLEGAGDLVQLIVHADAQGLEAACCGIDAGPVRRQDAADDGGEGPGGGDGEVRAGGDDGAGDAAGGAFLPRARAGGRRDRVRAGG